MPPERPRGLNPDDKKPFWTKNKFVAAIAAATLGAIAGNESHPASSAGKDVFPQTHEEKFERATEVGVSPEVEGVWKLYKASAKAGYPTEADAETMIKHVEINLQGKDAKGQLELIEIYKKEIPIKK